MMFQLVEDGGVETALPSQQRRRAAGPLFECGKVSGFFSRWRRRERGFDFRERRFQPGDGVFEGAARSRSLCVHRPTSPSTGLLAVAYIFRGMRPARYARRPQRTASFIASAITTGSWAPAMAVFISTAS